MQIQMFYLTSLPNPPSQGLVIIAFGDTNFGGKVDFCGGRNIGERRKKPSESD